LERGVREGGSGSIAKNDRLGGPPEKRKQTRQGG